MKVPHLKRRWKHGFSLLLKALRRELKRCRRTGSMESVHALRVVLRRFRLTVKLGRSALKKSHAALLLDWTKTVSDHLGPVRDMDMGLVWLKEYHSNAPLETALAKGRAQAWQTARRSIGLKWRIPVKTGVFLAALQQVSSSQLERRHNKIHSKSYLSTAGFSGDIPSCPTEHWHELRRQVRQVRYLRELTLPASQVTKDKLVRLLVALQTALGEAQNLNAAQQAIDKASRQRLSRTVVPLILQQQEKCLLQAQQKLTELRDSKAWKKAGPTAAGTRENLQQTDHSPRGSKSGSPVPGVRSRRDRN